MSAEVADVLRDALALIEDERNWAQLETARDGATCAGLAVAQAAEMRPVLKSAAWAALKAQMSPNHPGLLMAVADFNDTHTHPEVVAAFKDAIRAEEWSE